MNRSVTMATTYTLYLNTPILFGRSTAGKPDLDLRRAAHIGFAMHSHGGPRLQSDGSNQDSDNR